MRRIAVRSALIATTFALMVAACGGDTPLDAPITTSTTTDPASTTTAPTPTTEAVAESTTTTTTTTTTVPTGPTLAVEGDKNATVEAAQFLLNCGGHGDLTVDGSFGPATRAAVGAAETALGMVTDSKITDALFAELSRSCSQQRRLDGEGAFTVVGNTSPEDPEIYPMALLSGSALTAAISEVDGLTVGLTDSDGEAVEPQDDGSWAIEATGDYLLTAVASETPTTFELNIDVTTGAQETGAWIIAPDGITYDGTKLALGADAETVLDKIYDFLGHGVRGAYAEFDTGWHNEPGGIGLRGVFIEGMAFLFYGPDPVTPDRPETLARIRFEGPGKDADGNDRPPEYVTTAEGITVGDTLTDLKAAYGSSVKAGSNDDEWYYRLTASGKELCFYFATNPTEFTAITEIATQCRD